MGFWPTWNRYNAAPKRPISTAKMYFNYICTEIIFLKNKEEIQVIPTVKEFLRFDTNLSNQHYANYHEIRGHMRRFIIQIYRRRTFFNSLIFSWMNDINKTI